MDREKEIKDVEEAGSRVLNLISLGKKELGSARNWGVLDIMSSGVISSVLKHSRVKKAKKIMADIDRELVTFRSELKDLDISPSKISGLELVFDVVWDNLFVDLLVQGKIKDNIRELDRLEREIKKIINTLK